VEAVGGTGTAGTASQPESAAALAELEAEAYAAEPLTWLEAAVFSFFALSTYPQKADVRGPLAMQRWESYLASASIIDAEGEAARALLAARERRAGAGEGGTCNS